MKMTDLPLTELQKNCELLLLQNSELTHTVKHQKEQIEWLQKQLFGRKSERYVKDDGQLYFPGFENMAFPFYLRRSSDKRCLRLPLTIRAK